MNDDIRALIWIMIAIAIVGAKMSRLGF